MKRTVSRTPKVFATSYRPPQPKNPLLPKAWRGIAIVVAAVIVITLIARLPYFQLRHISLDGTDDQELINELNELLGHSIFSNLAERRLEQIRFDNPSIDRLECKRGLPDTLRCSITYRQPQLLWQIGSEQFLVDESGVLYGKKSTELPELLVVEDPLTTNAQVGNQVASVEVVTSFKVLREALAAKQLPPLSLTLSESLYQVSAKIGLPSGKQINALFLLTGPLNSQVASLEATIREKGDSIGQYVDVRVSGYVFTK